MFLRCRGKDLLSSFPFSIFRFNVQVTLLFFIYLYNNTTIINAAYNISYMPLIQANDYERAYYCTKVIAGKVFKLVKKQNCSHDF